jgi:hypothetical protein
MAHTKTLEAQGLRSVFTPTMHGPGWMSIDFDYPAAAPSANDVHVITPALEGYLIEDWAIVSDDIDTNASPTVVLALGVTNAAGTDLKGTNGTFATSLTIAQGGGVARMGTSAPLLYGKLGASDAIGIKFTGAPATYATGKKGRLLLLIELAA